MSQNYFSSFNFNFLKCKFFPQIISTVRSPQPTTQISWIGFYRKLILLLRLTLSGFCSASFSLLPLLVGIHRNKYDNVSSANQPLRANRANQLWGRGGRGNLQKQGRGGRGDLQKCDYLHFCKSPLPPLPRSWFARFARRGWFALDMFPNI